MSKRWYAIQVGDYDALDYGSTIKRKAMSMARKEARENPCKSVKVITTYTDSDYCDDEIIIQEPKQVVELSISRLLKSANLTQTELSKRFDIPLRTVQEWAAGRRTPPTYVIKLLSCVLGLN